LNKNTKTKDLDANRDSNELDAIIAQSKGQVIITNNNINNYIISNPKIEVTTNLPQHTITSMTGFVQNPHISGIHTTIHPSQITPAPSANGKLLFNQQAPNYSKAKGQNLLNDNS
jgi:hypothetical protein